MKESPAGGTLLARIISFPGAVLTSAPEPAMRYHDHTMYSPSADMKRIGRVTGKRRSERAGINETGLPPNTESVQMYVVEDDRVANEEGEYALTAMTMS